MKNSVFNGKFKWILTPKLNFTILTNHSNSPKANDPGALTIEAAIDRKAARDRNVLFNAGELVEQARLGLIGEAVLSNHQTIFANRMVIDTFVWRLACCHAILNSHQPLGPY